MISVVIPTRNPNPKRLNRTLNGLREQDLPSREWEVILVDNASAPTLQSQHLAALGRSAQIVREQRIGLTPARLAGIAAARGDIIVFVDDDNVLRSHYLSSVASHFHSQPKLGAAGGPVIPEWETEPPAWTREFHGLLALRDLGPDRRLAVGGPNSPWPNFAPVGAGLALRRSFALDYATAVAEDPRRQQLDRVDGSLASGGDNDLVFSALHSGGDVGYFPDLQLTHLIPAGRLERDYLARLNRGIMRTWVKVLALHDQCPWPSVGRHSVMIRVTRAWWRCRAWRGPIEYVRWSGIRGQFEGQADLRRLKCPPH